MLKGKKVLVTGGAGFVGANLVMRLLEEGADVRATLHQKPAIIGDPRIEYVHCDLRNAADCRNACHGVNFVVLCAAVTSGAAVIEATPLVHLTPNVVMNSLMLEAAYAAGVKKVIFISSNTVYPLTDRAVSEADVTNEFYEKYFVAGWMKRFSEIMCEMYATKIKKPMSVIVLRPANIYGPYDDFEWHTSHVLPALIRKVVEHHNPIEVWGDGKDVKDFIYVKDFLEGVVLSLQELDGFHVLNIASGKGYVLNDLLHIMLKLEKLESTEVVYNSAKPSMIPLRLIDPTLAMKLIGFEARTPIEEGLRLTMDWYKISILQK
jgi:GDP-L-fucose synthase